MELAGALRLVTQAADGLEDAHTKGLVHRDIKPHNLLLGKDGYLKITDFGLVHATEGSDLTTDGTRIGTPRYMAPEACEGKQTTIQSDIYALGVVFYELLAGTMAFKAENTLAIMRMIVDSPFPDIRRVRPEIPADVVKIIAKATRKRPEERYESCTEMLADLRSYAESGTLRVADAIVLDEPVGGTPAPLPSLPYAGASPLPALAGTPPPLEEGAPEFAVHFVKADQSWAEWIEKKLTGAGYEVASVEWDVTKGQDYLRMLLRTAEQGTVIVSVVSPAYIGSIHRDPKWAELFYQQTLPILPVHVRKSDVGNLLKSHQAVDFTELDHRRSEQVLLEEAKRVRGEPRNPKARQTSTAIVPTAELLSGKHHGIFNVRLHPEPNFVGRDKPVREIFAAFEAQKQGVVILGDPEAAGMGASQLAAEYAHLNKYNYDIVWWIDARNTASILPDVVALASQLSLSTANAQKITTAAQALRGSLAELSRWLIIMDDVQDKSDVARYLPTEHRGHVIVTTTKREVVPASYSLIRVNPLDREASIQYLFRSTGERNEGAGASLAQALGDVPLALRLAAGFITTSRCGTDDYVDQYLDRYRSLWGREGAKKHPIQFIAAAISLAADRLGTVNPAALELLKFAVYLDQSVSVPRIGMMGRVLPRSLNKLLTDNRRLQEAFKELCGLGLVSMHGDVLSVPALVQESIRTWLETEPKSAEEGLRDFLSEFRTAGDKRSQTYWCELAVKGVLALFPDDADDLSLWAEYDRMLGHAHAVLDNAARSKVLPADGAELWTRIGEYYQARALFEYACGSFRRSIKLATEAKGENHLSLAPHYDRLAKAFRLRGRLEDSRAAYEQSLALQLKNRSKDYAQIADTYVGLGNVAMALRDLPSARQYYLRALEEDQKLKGPEADENEARDYTQLGLVSQELGDLTAAWDYYSKALERIESVHEEFDPDVSLAVKNMGGLLKIMGDLDNARNYYKRALKIDLHLYDEHHPFVAQDRNNLGLVLQHLGFLDEASAELRMALEIDEKTYGSLHPKVALNKNNVGNILHAQGRLKEALRYYQEAATTFLQALGKHHEHTQTAIRNVRKVQEQIKRQDKSGPKVSD